MKTTTTELSVTQNVFSCETWFLKTFNTHLALEYHLVKTTLGSKFWGNIFCNINMNWLHLGWACDAPNLKWDCQSLL